MKSEVQYTRVSDCLSVNGCFESSKHCFSKSNTTRLWPSTVVIVAFCLSPVGVILAEEKEYISANLDAREVASSDLHLFDFLYPLAFHPPFLSSIYLAFNKLNFFILNALN